MTSARGITVIGVNPGHNATAALMTDGHLVALQSYERETRLKNSVCWPVDLVNRYVEQAGGYDALRGIGVTNNNAYHMMVIAQGAGQPQVMGGELGEGRPYSREAGRAYDDQALKTYTDFDLPQNRAQLPLIFQNQFGIPADKIRFFDHQMTHAYSTLPFMPEDKRNERWLVFTLDGMGDGKSGTVSLYTAGSMIVLEEIPDTYSLGLIYACVTTLLGFKAYEHEYKIMGLAPYAKGAYWKPLVAKFEELLRFDPLTGAFSGQALGMMEREAALAEIIAFQRFDNVAAALQAYVEQQVENLISAWVARTGVSHIACAGGFFMNVKANQRLTRLPGVEYFAVVPSSGDESAAIGSAVLAGLEVDPSLYHPPVKGLYLGRSYDRQEIEDAIRATGAANRYVVSQPDDMAEAIADILAAGGVVARCSGAMEFGARALGNRSILADPSRLDTVTFINQAIKSRDFWMPFAPSVLQERASDYFDMSDKASPDYMMISYNATPLAREKLIAATHQGDRTLRPQIVRADWNPEYHALISAFERRTGIGAVLNTSFNIHGEPIVMSPADAISTMDRSGLRHLVLGHLLLQKRDEA
ncbi:carbamoyltransferase C-terminal domain-containing protein [Lacibacterium aquatile]|uniref:Carbamoyltransferase C-terminal domain-containing protein n=1 Tax=Lacibacterium aquatile TaxID=1168082 RepID=A0ABW5DWW6_9PROT